MTSRKGPLARLKAMRSDIRTVKASSRQTLSKTRALRSDVRQLKTQVDELLRVLNERDARDSARHERLVHALRVVRDDDVRTLDWLWQMRASPDYDVPFTEANPLVTIIVVTYVDWELLRDRALPSILEQTYGNFEAIIVGDCSPPETAEVVEGFGDDRLRFVNRAYRGPYPDDPSDAWRVYGTTPYNIGLELAEGLWIGCVDEDDALLPHHIETLVELGQRERAEVPYGGFNFLEPDGSSTPHFSFPPATGSWGVQGALFHRALRHMTLNTNDWLFNINVDMSFMERLLRIGVRFAATPDPVWDYYPGLLWRDQGDKAVT